MGIDDEKITKIVDLNTSESGQMKNMPTSEVDLSSPKEGKEDKI